MSEPYLGEEREDRPGDGAPNLGRGPIRTVQEIVGDLLSKGVLIEPDALEYLRDNPSLLQSVEPSELRGSLTKNYLEDLSRGAPHAQFFSPDEGVRILHEYIEKFDMKGELSDFVNHFTSRYDQLSSLIRNRPEMRNLLSLSRLSGVREREEVSLIGIVSSKRETRAGHTVIDIEDETGMTKVLISKNSPAMKRSDEIVEDEIIGINGSAGNGIVFAEEVLFPDVPQGAQWPSSSKNVAVMISDIHIGSKQFMAPLFEKFINWMNSTDPIARRVKYLTIAGDVVDGVGIYKGQQKDLEIQDISKQYEALGALLDRINKRVKIFLSPGNHDASRDADPQPAIPREFAHTLYSMQNVSMVSSPASIQLDGVNFLLYHGTALDSIIAAIPSLRKTGYDNPHQAMIQQLRKRHLIPIYGELTRMFPDSVDDMVVSKVPNVFHSGHVHKLGFSTYRGVRVVNSGTFQDRTAFQVKTGHHPQPGRIPLIELGTGTLRILNLLGEDGTVEGQE